MVRRRKRTPRGRTGPYTGQHGATTFVSTGALDHRLPVWVGIDQSLTGFAIVALAEDETYHGWLHSPKKPPKAPVWEDTLRLALHRQYLTQVLSDISLRSPLVKGYAMEGYSYGSQASRSHLAGELGGMIKLELWTKRRVHPAIVPPTTLKKFVTGNGQAKKDLMLMSIYKSWGVEFSDDNLGDAYALARVARALDTGEETKARLESLKAVQVFRRGPE